MAPNAKVRMFQAKRSDATKWYPCKPSKRVFGAWIATMRFVRFAVVVERKTEEPKP